MTFALELKVLGEKISRPIASTVLACQKLLSLTKRRKWGNTPAIPSDSGLGQGEGGERER